MSVLHPPTMPQSVFDEFYLHWKSVDLWLIHRTVLSKTVFFRSVHIILQEGWQNGQTRGDNSCQSADRCGTAWIQEVIFFAYSWFPHFSLCNGVAQSWIRMVVVSVWDVSVWESITLSAGRKVTLLILLVVFCMLYYSVCVVVTHFLLFWSRIGPW